RTLWPRLPCGSDSATAVCAAREGAIAGHLSDWRRAASRFAFEELLDTRLFSFIYLYNRTTSRPPPPPSADETSLATFCQRTRRTLPHRAPSGQRAVAARESRTDAARLRQKRLSLSAGGEAPRALSGAAPSRQTPHDLRSRGVGRDGA